MWKLGKHWLNNMLELNSVYICIFYVYIYVWISIIVKKSYDINFTFLWKVFFLFCIWKNIICLCALKQHDIVKVENKDINEYIKETQTSNRAVLTYNI